MTGKFKPLVRLRQFERGKENLAYIENTMREAAEYIALRAIGGHHEHHFNQFMGKGSMEQCAEYVHYLDNIRKYLSN